MEKEEYNEEEYEEEEEEYDEIEELEEDEEKMTEEEKNEMQELTEKIAQLTGCVVEPLGETIFFCRDDGQFRYTRKEYDGIGATVLGRMRKYSAEYFIEKSEKINDEKIDNIEKEEKINNILGDIFLEYEI